MSNESSVRIHTPNLERLIRALGRDVVRGELQNALRDVVEEVLDTPGARAYPPQSEANMPGRFSLKTRRPMGYYLRGQGWMGPIMRKATLARQRLARGDSESTGQAARRSKLDSAMLRQTAQVAGYKLRPTSQRYGTQFVTRSGAETDSSISVRVGNRASYAPFIGFGKQAALMGKRGWRKLAEIAHEKRAILQNIVMERIGKLLTRR